ncbi:hypothetical protein AJ78_01397 [Emergomyces pasteurianus Ep9510]|uniref:Uncharacterized protein n=1 Tax=Emergomyces pasteurianus Ep9510 TaxID=1447872 RepID=A0A1J9QRP0_9EURO|nr:hypothetical protein AJ78_01397 [Emergomyces pasteurianus Ep9510]
MKLWSLPAAFFAVAVMLASATAAENATPAISYFRRLHMPLPLNWLYGDKLGDRILRVFDAAYPEYNVTGWLNFVAMHCVDWYYCNTTMVYTVGNGDQKNWMGVLFQGPHATQDDFYREQGVGNSIILNRFRTDTASVA